MMDFSNIYWTTLYTNYQAYKENPNKCMLKTIKFQNNEFAEQMALPCHGRTLVVPVGKQPEEYTFHNDIWIYPVVDYSMIVLQCGRNTEECILLEEYKITLSWRLFPIARESLFHKPEPRSITNKEEIYNYFVSNVNKFSVFEYVSLLNFH